jgi:hypothetical protein
MEIENVVCHTILCHGHAATNSVEALCIMRELCYSIDAPQNMYNIILIKVGASQCFYFHVYCVHSKLTFAAPFHFTCFQTKANRFLKMVAWLRETLELKFVLIHHSGQITGFAFM